ncbi:MotA/TolQ/ExbB proton channel family protein [Novosphingobium sp. P6W]|uniref:MotA/TolQ/ExbB proton channel family protein n=1 Tax=Novosphingobium sp. P6W TaxID=1609758 RepID=UPI0005C30DBC|nr:MotA/TolQ/ExbB proton channel family protein [Novosphingobium sp. P6W]AXB75663.1 chemotaxis protein MotA [Novosphingobium sp. P6W]KIS33112.1 chemotaxis protein MotA [Novosphingobium sp. P6W]
MISHTLFDPAGAAIVVGGTCLATVLRCGVWDTRMAFAGVARLTRPRFRAAQARAELAPQVQEIQQDGVIRAEPHHFGDEEFDAVTDALIGSRSMGGLQGAHVSHKRRRVDQSRRAVRTLEQAAELSPVFGLAGTLVALTRLPADPGAASDFTSAISMAVLTTLYGLLLGNLLFAPLARMIARRAAQEEHERQRVLDWLESQVAGALPGALPGGGRR